MKKKRHGMNMNTYNERRWIVEKYEYIVNWKRGEYG